MITKLAEQIASDILSVGDENGIQCKRIQFMLGKWPNEVSGGGLCKEALAGTIEESIREMLSVMLETR